MRTFIWLLASLFSMTMNPVLALTAPEIADLKLVQVQPWFGQATRLGDEIKPPGYHLVYQQNTVQGAVFFTHQILPIPAYSGKPIATLVAINTQATIVGLRIVSHEEPILVVGVKEQDLTRFTEQYRMLSAQDKVRINAFNRPGYTGVDGISGATITAMVLNRSIMGSAKKIAGTLGWPSPHPTEVDALTDSKEGSRLLPHLLDSWQRQKLTIITLALALGLLLFILFFQDWLVKKPRLFRNLRTGYLIFTVIVVGYIFSAQLSIINILAFIQTLNYGFTWETLILDAGIFLIWSFVAISILLWGRGVFCGWLCPFGAMQELIHQLARKLKLPKLELPSALHERLWAIKYFILIVLVGISLDSFNSAAILSEVEPFKTAITLHFARDWAYVAYAIGLLLISAFNSKFFCKYLCALGAGLSILGRFRIFDWLRRRNECGKPCQACANLCQIAAIKPTGEIIDNECHYCLECQVIYRDDHICPPLVEKRKRKEKRDQARQQAEPIKIIANQPIS